MKLSIIMPVFNEEKTVRQILQKVADVSLPWEKEIIVVNDASTDRSVQEIKKVKDIIYLEHQTNLGKGAAVKTGIAQATGDYIVIQDADLEYDPKDIGRLIQTASPGVAVYGSRLTEPPILSGKNKTPLLLHYFGNKLLSLTASLLYGAWLTDIETCYKLFPKKAVEKMRIRARGFEFEPEITAKLLKAGYKIREIPIQTKPRGYEEGKKLNTWRDGWRALKTLVKYRFQD